MRRMMVHAHSWAFLFAIPFFRPLYRVWKGNDYGYWRICRVCKLIGRLMVGPDGTSYIELVRTSDQPYHLRREATSWNDKLERTQTATVGGLR